MYMHVYRSVMTRVSGSSTSLFLLSVKLSTGFHPCRYGSRGVEYTKEQQLYRILVPSCHILLTFCIRIGTFDHPRVSGLVQVFQVSCIIVTRVRVQRANMDH